MNQLFENTMLALLFTSLVIILVSLSFIIFSVFAHKHHRKEFILQLIYALVLSILHALTTLVHVVELYSATTLVYIVLLNIIALIIYVFVGKYSHYLTSKKLFYTTIFLFCLSIITQFNTFFDENIIIEIIEELSPVLIILIFFFTNLKYHIYLRQKKH